MSRAPLLMAGAPPPFIVKKVDRGFIVNYNIGVYFTKEVIMAVNTTIGHPARGAEYFERPQLTGKLWEKIKSGGSILLAAPRRVGKSTIMFYIEDNPADNYRPAYIDTESVNNENEFFKKLFNLIIHTLSSVSRYAKTAANFSKDLAARIESIGAEGIAIGDSRLNYFDEFQKLVKSLDMKGDRFIIMVDEFAETVQNIIKDEGERKAVHFLQSNRTLRMTPGINEKVQFIFAGSIGLENIVDTIGASAAINDLYSFDIPPFSRGEARQLVSRLIEGTGYVMDEKSVRYLLDKIEWLIPFYVQLIIDEADRLDFPEGARVIDDKIIDRAFLRAVRHRSYFDNWHARLRKAYKGSEYSFTKALLNYASEHDTVTSAAIGDLAAAYEMEADYKNILNTLKYDGYINNHDDPKIYRFNSPLLKMWWSYNVAN